MVGRILLRNSTKTLSLHNFSYAGSLRNGRQLFASAPNGITRNNNDDKHKRTLVTSTTANIANINVLAASCLDKNKRTRVMSTSATSTKISNIIDNNKVVIFSKSYCPFCNMTKDLFTNMGVENVEVLELDLMGGDGDDISNELLKLTKQRTFPNVFVMQQHIGGNDDTQAAGRNGTLQELLGI
ncbi:MAG: glutaredoxin 3 [Bacillariaceae sp.]|jgi:glutaredoxin 3